MIAKARKVNSPSKIANHETLIVLRNFFCDEMKADKHLTEHKEQIRRSARYRALVSLDCPREAYTFQTGEIWENWQLGTVLDVGYRSQYHEENRKSHKPELYRQDIVSTRVTFLEKSA
jgi:hypothetical protein